MNTLKSQRRHLERYSLQCAQQMELAQWESRDTIWWRQRSLDLQRSWMSLKVKIYNNNNNQTNFLLKVLRSGSARALLFNFSTLCKVGFTDNRLNWNKKQHGCVFLIGVILLWPLQLLLHGWRQKNSFIAVIEVTHSSVTLTDSQHGMLFIQSVIRYRSLYPNYG